MTSVNCLKYPYHLTKIFYQLKLLFIFINLLNIINFIFHQFHQLFIFINLKNFINFNFNFII